MEQSTIAALIGAVSGLISGAVASLIAPWVHWGIEQKRTRRASRRALLAEAREYVASNLFSGTTFSAKPIYRQLKPYLHREVVDVIENYETFLDQSDDPGQYPRWFRQGVLDEISRLERKWGLL